MRKVLLRNIVAVASYCPIPSVARYARIIRFGDGHLSNENQELKARTDVTSSSQSNHTKLENSDKNCMDNSSSSSSISKSGSVKINNQKSFFRKLLIASKEKTHGKRLSSSFALMTEEEIDELNRQREMNANAETDSMTPLLVSRPSRSILIGTVYALWDVGVGVVIFPFAMLSMSIEKSRNSSLGVLGIPFGPVYGFSWAMLFTMFTWYAALQQILQSFVNGFIFRPWLFCFARSQVYLTKHNGSYMTNTSSAIEQTIANRFTSSIGAKNASYACDSSNKHSKKEEEYNENFEKENEGSNIYNNDSIYDNSNKHMNKAFTNDAVNEKDSIDAKVDEVHKECNASTSSFFTTMRIWNDLLCRYERVTEIKHKTSFDSIKSFLSTDDVIYHHLNWSNEMLHDRAMKRLNRRNSVMNKNNNSRGQYKSTEKTKQNNDYYALLGVPHDATNREIKSAYNKKVLTVHPDRNPGNPNAAQEFDTLTKAYKVLSSDKLRRKYNVGGESNVDNVHLQKRSGVIALFGGDELRKLIGDVLFAGFSCRVIDGCDYAPEELAILRLRMLASCKKELLEEYLVHYKRTNYINENEVHEQNMSSSIKAATVDTKNNDYSISKPNEIVWNIAMKEKLRLVSETGLAKEVLFAIGQEYLRVIKYFDAEFDTLQSEKFTNDKYKDKNMNCKSNVTKEEKSLSTSTEATEKLQNEAKQVFNFNKVKRVTPLIRAWRRMRFYMTDLRPRRREIRRRRNKVIMGMKTGHIMDDTASLVDLAWFCGISEMEFNARCVAFQVLYEEVNAHDVQWRRNALEALARLFIHYGQPYKGANKATIDALMSSMHQYQSRKTSSQSTDETI